MKLRFYPRLAVDGIRKNRQVYLPYILTCVCMVMMYVIMASLGYGEALNGMPGGQPSREILIMGSRVMAIFAGIFLFYTNSFLMRRRKKEFGLYAVLGMGKGNIGLLLLFETGILFVVSLSLGLLVGVGLSKMAEMGLAYVLGNTAGYRMTVSVSAITMTLRVFGVIFALLYVSAWAQIKFSGAVTLLRSENVGEKAPKANWLLGVLGVLILGAAYYMAVTIKNPVDTLGAFFIAVIMVIVATYLLFIAGSVVMCRLLQKSKRYYYRKNHFISVSSMAYRMKRNGAGLASVCILATMVLVMISATAALYFGTEDSLRSAYPREENICFYADTAQSLSDEKVAELESTLLGKVDGLGLTADNIIGYRSACIAGVLEKDTVDVRSDTANAFQMDSYDKACQIAFVPLEDYSRITGDDRTLAPGQALLYTVHRTYTEDTIRFIGGESFQIQGAAEDFTVNGTAAISLIPTMVLIVPDFPQAVEKLSAMRDAGGSGLMTLRWDFGFDTDADGETQTVLDETLENAIREENWNAGDVESESRESRRGDFYGMYGGLFYLGILLSIVFIFATVLILYYKQISEGYEDQSRFQIMQKVGMTDREIRSSINSQLLTVFFLPLVMALMHLTFAYPIIRKLLLLFNLNNTALFITTTSVSFLIFALFYSLVYRITSGAYYRIVRK